MPEPEETIVEVPKPPVGIGTKSVQIAGWATLITSVTLYVQQVIADGDYSWTTLVLAALGVASLVANYFGRKSEQTAIYKEGLVEKQ